MDQGGSQGNVEKQIAELRMELCNLDLALAESEKKFRTLTDHAPVGIFLDDANGKAIYINKKCADLVGVSPDQALEFGWLPHLHPDDRDRMWTAWEKAYTAQSVFRMEYRWLHADGTMVWTLGEVVPVFGEDGEVNRFIGTLTDITSRKEAEQAQKELQRRLEQAERMESIGRLAGGIAHDYNNMIHVILGNAELAMASTPDSSPLQQQLASIQEAAERSADITRQLLTFARKKVTTPKVFDLNTAVDNMLRMLGRLIGEEIELVWNPAPQPLHIKMDPAHLDQIVMNLCINARDAIEGPGRITLQAVQRTLTEPFCGEHPGTTPGETVILSIHDTGSGMDPQTQEKIFEPFFTTKDENSGTGLGLATVYGTVQLNKGFIQVDSTPGSGTTFEVFLPAQKRRTTPPTDPSSERVTLTPGRGQQILLVEDELPILTLVRNMLKELGYCVLTAQTGEEALNLSREHHGGIDLLITDMIMPDTNGRDLGRQLQKEQPGMRCLRMSGYSPEVLPRDSEHEKTIPLLAKPFSMQDLQEKIHEVLHQSGS